MKTLVLVSALTATSLLSSCSTGARTIQSVNRTANNAVRATGDIDEAAVRSQGTVLRTGDTAARTYEAYESARSNAVPTARRTQGTMNRLFDSFFRIFE